LDFQLPPAAHAQAAFIDGLAELFQQGHNLGIALVPGKSDDLEIRGDLLTRRQGRQSIQKSRGVHLLDGIKTFRPAMSPSFLIGVGVICGVSEGSVGRV
jgi:hypothetical protein